MVSKIRRSSIARRDPLAATTRIVLNLSPGVYAVVEPPQPDTTKIELEDGAGFLLEHSIEIADVTYPS